MTPISPPPSRIYLLRHADSTPAVPGQRDFDRALSDKGFAQAEIVADRAGDMGYRPGLVISSTALRTRQTTEAFKRALNDTAEIRYVDALYSGPQSTYIEILAAQTDFDSVALVGHNPFISQALETLIGHAAIQKALPNGYPTSGLAVLDPVQSTDGATTTWILADFLSE